MNTLYFEIKEITKLLLFNFLLSLFHSISYVVILLLFVYICLNVVLKILNLFINKLSFVTGLYCSQAISIIDQAR